MTAETFPRLLADNAAHHAAKPAIVTPERTITHGELETQSRAVAAALTAAGVSRSSRVGLLAPNSIEWAVSAAAVMRAGAVLVPLSTLLRPPELEQQLQVAAVTYLIAARRFRGRDYEADLETLGLLAGGRQPIVPALHRIWFIDELPTYFADAAVEPTVRPADDLVILFTSGSRGLPKGVIHTHGGGLRAVGAGLASRCIGPDDRVYIPMPWFWTGGFCSGLLSVMVAGATLLTETAAEPEQTLEFLASQRCTLFRGWPDQAARLAAHRRFADTDLSSLGPGSLPAVLPPSMRPKPGARPNLFGMTETFGPYCGAPLDVDMPDAKHGSCGQVFAGFEVRILDPVTQKIGEIGIRGPNIMRGICGRTRDITFDADGFYRTGDLGVVDDDGYLWYHGRSDDMFKVKGATVYPTEVEAAIRAIPGVRLAHVTNVPQDDGTDEVGALVVTSHDLDHVKAAARERLSAFKVPSRWVLVADAEDVPMTATAKVDKTALQDLFKTGSST